MGAQRKKLASSISFATSVALKADTQAVVDQALEIEDEFNSLYEVASGGVVLLAPPFAPNTLVNLCTRNNILQQCVHAMEVNVDGTGHTIEPIEVKKKPPATEPILPLPSAPPPPATAAAPAPAKKDDTAEENNPQKKKAEAFFKEPFPGMSMVAIRRKLRVDLEQCGYGYLEALRNITGELVFIRHVDAPTIRMVKLDNPVPVLKTVKRDGQDLEVTVLMRERRYMQMVGTKRIYFREFGSSRQIDKTTGAWIDPKDLTKYKPTQLGTELIGFIVDRDSKTPYGVPRWINNLPSALGSRKAEEFNLEFFDAGGLPPALILIAGGALTTTVKEQLLAHLSGKGRTKHRAAVVEIQSADGGIDGPGKRVDVKVERFGDAKQNDSMFQKYDEKCEEHVRVSFRLPPLFVGRSSDYSFATAMTSYMIAEEQVFAPERLEFDEVMNSTIMKELGVTDFKFVSNPMTLKNVEIMLEGIALSKDVIDGAERVESINKITGLTLQYSPAAEKLSVTAASKVPFGGGGDPTASAGAGKGVTAALNSRALGGAPLQPQKQLSQKDEFELTANDIVTLVHKWSIAAKLEAGEMSDDERKAILSYVEALKGEARDLFNHVLATKSFVNASLDPHGISELSGTCAHLSARSVQVTAKSSDESHLLAAAHGMADAVRESNERMIELVQKALVSERPINLHVELQVPERKAVKKTIKFSDGRQATVE